MKQLLDRPDDWKLRIWQGEGVNRKGNQYLIARWERCVAWAGDRCSDPQASQHQSLTSIKTLKNDFSWKISLLPCASGTCSAKITDLLVPCLFLAWGKESSSLLFRQEHGYRVKYENPVWRRLFAAVHETAAAVWLRFEYLYVERENSAYKEHKSSDHLE